MQIVATQVPRARLALVAAAASASLAFFYGPPPSRAAMPGECVVHSLPSFVAQGPRRARLTEPEREVLSCLLNAAEPTWIVVSDPNVQMDRGRLGP